MSDDPSKRGKPDRARISMKQIFERRYWCKKFGCTDTALREAAKGSPMVADIKRKLIERIEKA